MLGMTLITHQTGPAGRVVQAPLYRGRLGHRARTLSLGAGRPRHQPHRLHRLHRRRHGHRGSGAQDAGKNSHLPDRSGRRLFALCRQRDRRGAGAQGRCSQADGNVVQGALRRLHRQGHEPAGNQSAGRHQGRQVICLDAKINFDDNALYRHKDMQALRDPDEEDPAEVRSRQIRPHLHQARRRHRLHGERRGPGHGDHGHHQALRRRARQLPGCRRRRHQGKSHGRPSRSFSAIPT